MLVQHRNVGDCQVGSKALWDPEEITAGLKLRSRYPQPLARRAVLFWAGVGTFRVGWGN